MNQKFSLKSPANLQTEVKELISFEEKECLLWPQGEASQKNTPPKEEGILSKYATVLSCSFANSTRESNMIKGKQVLDQRLFQPT